MAITLISCPAGLCLAGNMPKLMLTAGADVRVRLLDGDKTLLDETYTPDFSGAITLDLSEVVRNALHFVMPDAGVFIQPDIARPFTLLLNDDTYAFTAIRTGVRRLNVEPAAFLTQNFLTWQPQTKKVAATQPEWLTYYATRACYLYVTAEVYNKNIRAKKMATLSAGNVYTFDTSVDGIARLIEYPPVRYSIYVVATDSPSGPRLSHIQQYIVTDSVPNEQVFCFQNSLGGIDTLRCTGKTKQAPEYTPATALMNEVEDTYHVEKKELTTQNSGWLNKAASAWLHDFFTAKQRYKYEDEALQAIVVDEVTAETSTTEELISFEFTCRPAIASEYMDLKHDFGAVIYLWKSFVNILENNKATSTDVAGMLEVIDVKFNVTRTYNLLSAFGAFPGITVDQWRKMALNPRTERIEAFKAYINNLEVISIDDIQTNDVFRTALKIRLLGNGGMRIVNDNLRISI